MARRTTQLFNLSLLDILTSALGAIIFLFIITPKGGKSASEVQQAVIYFDTSQMKIHGTLPDSLLAKQPGDTLLTIVVDYKNLPKVEKQKKVILAANTPKPQPKKEVPAPSRERIIEQKKPVNLPPAKQPEKETAKKKETNQTPAPKPKPTPTPPKKTEVKETKSEPSYRGDAPSVPARVSIEIKWPDQKDNVDLFVCKGNNCVYGARKRDRNIGQWDSGKSRNRLFGNDFRTNQEAVRQFDRIIPGTYKIFAQFKESEKNRSSLSIQGLIYTKDEKGKERGESFTKKLAIGKDRIQLGTLIIKEDGSYHFKK